jgi:hypothetical protein
MTLLARIATVLCSNIHSGSFCGTTQPGASDWLLALPVPHLQQTMPPESFRCRLQYQLLIPIFQQGSQCPCCLRELDVWGDHAVHCTSGRDVNNVAIVGRNYSVRNGLDAVLTSARQRVTGEPAFPTPVPGQERRRTDLRLDAWEEGRDLYIDIVGSCSLTVRLSCQLAALSAGLGRRARCPRQADSLCCLTVASGAACCLPSLRF